MPPSQWALLHIEDYPPNVLIVEELIGRRSDLKLSTATTGYRGIEMACSLLPDVILMDINLPDINGLDALKILRGHTATSHIPVIALSSNAYAIQIEDGLKAGFFLYLTKPYKLNALMKAIDDALQYAANHPPPRQR